MRDDYAEVIVTNAKDEEVAKALISIEDVKKIKGHHWSLNDNGYVRTFNGTTPVYLHRFLLDYNGEHDVDHINGDKRDNRRTNLRVKHTA